MSKNNITGDSLVTKAATDEYREGIDRIFGKRPPWYVTREQREKEQADEHRQPEAGQASTPDER